MPGYLSQLPDKSLNFIWKKGKFQVNTVLTLQFKLCSCLLVIGLNVNVLLDDTPTNIRLVDFSEINPVI